MAPAKDRTMDVSHVLLLTEDPECDVLPLWTNYQGHP